MYRTLYHSRTFVGNLYPRFLSGRGLLAALLTCVAAEVGLNSEPAWVTASFFGFRSFDSSRIFFAALAALLGRFFGAGITLTSHNPSAADNFFGGLGVVEDRGLARRNCTLRFVKNDACLSLG